MNRVDIRELTIQVTFPCVSIIIPCSSRNNCVEKLGVAIDAIIAQLKTSVKDDLLFQTVTRNLRNAQERVSIPVGTRTIIMFANKYAARAYYVPFVCEELLQVASMFATQPLSNKLNRVQRYWILFLYENRPYLIESYDGMLQEVVHHHNTFSGEQSYSVEDAAGKICDATQQWGAECRYSVPEEYIHKIDKRLQHFIESDQLPLMVIGSRKEVTLFLKYSMYKSAIIGSVLIDQLCPLSELGEQIEPLLQKYYKNYKKESLLTLQEAHDAQLVITDHAAIWSAARSGIVRLLVVDATLHDYACEDTAKATLVQKKECGSLQAIDPIDDILELCASKAIPYCLVTAEELRKYGFDSRIAAVIRDDSN